MTEDPDHRVAGPSPARRPWHTPTRLARAALLAAAGCAIVVAALLASRRDDPAADTPMPAMSMGDAAGPTTFVATIDETADGTAATLPTGPFVFDVVGDFASTWEAAAAPQDPTLVIVSLVGNPPLDVDDYCTSALAADVAETPDAVTIKVVETQARRPGAWPCAGVGYPRQIAAQLTTALAGRPIIDARTGAAVGPATLRELPVTVVQPSEDLGDVAQRCGVSIDDLVQANAWYDGADHRVAAGDAVYLPG